jgi:hypothetical protein
LYNTRNTVREDKVKEQLGEDTVKEVEDWVQEGITWLDSYQEEEKDTYDEKFKSYEDKIKPVMMKLYANSGVPGQMGPGQMGPGQMGPGQMRPGTESHMGPTVDEVD